MIKITTSKSIFALALMALPVVGGASLIGCSTAPKQESTGQYIDSSVITTKVKAKLLNDPQVKSIPVTVKTYKSVVQLSGFVDNNYQKRRIVRLASEVEGVTEVEDFLVVKAR